MSLTSALGIAQSSLFSTSRQTSIVSRNVADANNPNYTRRSAPAYPKAPGVETNSIVRSTSEALFRHNLVARSAHSAQDALLAGLNRLGIEVNGIDNTGSPAAALGRLQEALQIYSAAPSNASLGEQVVEAARQMVGTLGSGTAAIQQFRTDVDAQIATAVSELNTLLNEFHRNNQAITKGTDAGRDVSDELDQRDALLKQIAQYTSVSTYVRSGNDMVLMSGDGAVLFETVPRVVAFEPTLSYDATVTGKPIQVDGMPLSPGQGSATTAQGSLGALLQLRDAVAPRMQAQFDEIARGLVLAFAETDPSGLAPDAPGLFTWPGAPGMPPPATVLPGLAGALFVNPAFSSASGGSPTLLRDGGANGAAYVHNSTGAASFADLLISHGDRIDAPLAFDSAAGAGGTHSLAAYSTNAISWLEAQRQEASRAAETKSALLDRTTAALSNATGVNIDEEMALLLQLEQTYQASARLIRAVDEMLAALIAAVR